MSKIERIKAELERRIEKCDIFYTTALNTKSEKAMSIIGLQKENYKSLLSFIDSLEEEPVSNDLEEELDKYFSQFKGLEKCYWNWRIDSINIHAQGIYDFAKHFAQWQKQQDQLTVELAEDHAYLAGQEKIIDKACEFLRSHIDKQLVIYHEHTWRSRDEFIEGLKKAMEE